MTMNSKIEWTHHTFNPWIGCTKVSAGCKNCYAEEMMATRFKKVEWGSAGRRLRTKTWADPVKWNAAAAAAGERHRVFCASLADVFEDRPELEQWRWELFELIRLTPHLDWLLLTKRPQHIKRMVWDATTSGIPDLPEPHILEAEKFADIFSHVWFGTSVEDQAAADERIPTLASIRDATVRFLSVEPLLERTYLDLTGINWVIVGGESGPNARPCKIHWIRDVIEQCVCASVPVFVKQLGAHAMAHYGRMSLQDSKGGDLPEWPECLRVREFPLIEIGSDHGR